jgi:hypothetical protein
MLIVNLNRCLHRARNLVSVPRSTAVRRLASKVCHSAHKDSMITAVLLGSFDSKKEMIIIKPLHTS